MAEDIFGIKGSLQAGAFRVTDVVAEGGFGVVYRAHHEGFRADVALKCLKIPGTISPEQKRDFLQKFREEGELLFRLSALIPAIVRPLHVGTIENAAQGAFVPFIALEWLEGESLERLVTRRRDAGKAPLDLTRAARLLGPGARALERAHKFPGPQGTVSVLHRDLKPENLFLAKVHGQETLKILDFGIGKVKSVATQIVGRVSSEGGLSAFTPAYGAPEQWLPKRYGQTGTWTDVWGFALTMVEVLAGRPPLEGDLQAVMGACMDERQRPTPRSLGVDVGNEAEAAFQKALAVDPRDRYQDLGEFWDAIEAVTGVRTPRIATENTPDLDSVIPPKRDHGDAIPDLDLGNIRPRIAAPKVPAELTELSRGQKPKPEVDMSEMQLLGNDAGGIDTVLAPPSGLGPRSFDLADPLPASHSRGGAPVRSGLDAAPARVAATYSVRSASVPPSASALIARAIPALKILGVAAAIMIADIAYATENGAPFTLGPARAFWVAGPLGVWGLFKLALGLLSE